MFHLLINKMCMLKLLCQVVPNVCLNFVDDPGTSSFTMKADTFLATMNMMGHAGEHTSTYSDNSYVIPGTHSSVERHGEY